MRIRESYSSPWAYWFAWYPVHVYVRADGEWLWVWLERVQRRRTGRVWEYRLPEVRS